MTAARVVEVARGENAFAGAGRRTRPLPDWELQQEPVGFRELRRCADTMSYSVLADRLRRLTDAGIVQTDQDGRYALTELGRAQRCMIRSEVIRRLGE